MRKGKLITRFRLARTDARRMAAGLDHQTIEPLDFPANMGFDPLYGARSLAQAAFGAYFFGKV